MEIQFIVTVLSLNFEKFQVVIDNTSDSSKPSGEKSIDKFLLDRLHFVTAAGFLLLNILIISVLNKLFPFLFGLLEVVLKWAHFQVRQDIITEAVDSLLS